MNYVDGSVMKVGDLIWWNEGCNRGRVALILETAEDLAEWGLRNYGFFISTDEHSENLKCVVYYHETDIEDEGIALIIE